MKSIGKLILITCFCLLANSLTWGQTNPIKTIEPNLGFAPDISVDAAKNFKHNRELWSKIDSIVQRYPNRETALKHLTKKQISIYENEEAFEHEDNLEVGPIGCSWYCGGGPDTIFASSELNPFKGITYKAENAHDFSLRTAWVEGVQGYGIGQSITYRFPKLSPPVTTVEIYNGYMKSDKAWNENSRVKQLKLYINDKPYAILNLRNTTALQTFKIGSHQGVKKNLFLKFEILDVYKGDKYDDVAIAELEFDGTGVHCMVKGTEISLPDGLTSKIENINIGDTVTSYNLQTGKLEPATVMETISIKHHNLYELDFEGMNITVTDDHPLYWNGSFYSINPNHKYGIATQKIVVGNKLLFYYHGAIQEKILTGIRSLNTCEMTYTVTKLNHNKIFFANGLAVLAEEIKSSDE